MQATLTPTRKTTTESPYLFNGFMIVDDVEVPVFIAQSGTNCEDCEWPLSNTRRHPCVEGKSGIHVDCSGHRVRLV